MRLIDADELLEHAGRDKLDSRELIIEMIQRAPTIMTDVVQCKDCKHRGEWERAEDIHGSYSRIVFPDGSLCPGQCEDSFYAWRPDDDWYCAAGERRDPDA